jgi:hypothetical protein
MKQALSASLLALALAAENIALVHAVIGKETIGGLRVRPILARQWNTLAQTATHLLQ